MDVTTAINGHQAFEILNKSLDFDLVVLDLHMPISDGYETCANIVKLYQNENIFKLNMKSKSNRSRNSSLN